MITRLMKDAIKRYIDDRIPPGGFLTAVLENNLVEAFMRADEYNREHLFEIISFVYNELRSDCWGSPEKVANWLAGDEDG